MAESRIFLVSFLLGSGGAVFLVSGIILFAKGCRIFIREHTPYNLELGLFLISLAFLLATVINGLIAYAKEESVIIVPVLTWFLYVLSIFLQMFKMKQVYLQIEDTVAILYEYKEFKSLADDLFVCYEKFGTGFPPRSFQKERRLYDKSLKKFGELELNSLPPGDSLETLKNYQKTFRQVQILYRCLFTAVVSVVLQFVALIVTNFIIR